MKSRSVGRKSSNHESISVRKLESEIVKSYTDLRLKKQSAANAFLQKSTQILQTYNPFFLKAQNLCDANSYFKKSLRNYDPLDLNSLTLQRRNRDSSLEKDPPPVVVTKERKQRSFYTHTTRTQPKDKKNKTRSQPKLIKVKKSKSNDSKSTSAKSTRSKSRESSIKELDEADEEFSKEPEVAFKPKKGEEEKPLEEPEEKTAPNSKMAEEVSDIDDTFGEVDELVNQVEEEIKEMELRQTASRMSRVSKCSSRVRIQEDKVETADIFSNEGEEVNVTTTGPTTEDETEEEILDTVKEVKEVAKAEIEEDDLIREIEECERQCMDIYNTVVELKNRVHFLLGKDDKSPEEEQELVETQFMLNEKMILMEQKTMKIEYLLNQRKTKDKPDFNRKHSEDMLPKVIFAGMKDGNVPNLIICDHKRKKKRPLQDGDKSIAVCPPPLTCPQACMPPQQPMTCMPQFAKKLSDSYCMQERLAAENADLEGKRFKLQEDLMTKDQTVESLQRKLCSLQCEYRMVVKENNLLQQKMQGGVCPAYAARGDTGDATCKPPSKQAMAAACGKGRAPCPAEMEQRIQECSGTTQQLEKQLGDIESDVRNLQNELVAVQKERLHLEQHRRMMASPCSPPPCGPPPPCGMSPCAAPCARPSSDQQLRELREKYNALQDDYKGKLTEVAGLRADVEHLKKVSTNAEETKKALQEKMNELEKELRALKGNNKAGAKEMMIELEQQLSVAKKRYLEAKDEAEEAQAQLKDQESLLDEYRRKYMDAEQVVEEQRRRIDMMELEGNRINEQVNLEIQRVKNQFQEKLQELTPLPDILKATQIKLQEAQQMHLIAERNNESLVRELQSYRDKALQMADQMEKVRSDQELGAGEKVSLQSKLAEAESRILILGEENERLEAELAQLRMDMDDCEKKCDEKSHEIAQLTVESDNVRDEAARQVSKIKERCESVRKSMQAHVSDLERQLVQSRAAARAAQKDRDEIRQKMQSQINNLNDNFEDAQMRIRTLQGHVNFLKSSYTNVFLPNDLAPESVDCNCQNF